MSGRELVVCHVLEAANAGVRRHVVDLLMGMEADATIRCVLIYSPVRMDAGFIDALPRLERFVECIALPMSPVIDPRRDVMAVLRMSSVLRRIRPDVLHVHSGKGGLLGRTAHMVARGKGAVVYTPNASPFRRGGVYESVERALCRRTDVVIAVSDSEAAELIEADVARADQVRVIESGIDVWAFEDADALRATGRRSLGCSPHDLLVGSVGRLAEQKAPLDFVAMAERVSRMQPRARFLWVGDGELRRAVEAAVAVAGLSDRFTITGLVADVRPYVAAMDVFCLLSLYESFGYATVEAMALEVPAVGTRVPGTIDVLGNGEAGVIVSPGRPTEAAEAVLALLNDQAERHRLARAGRDRTRARYDARRMCAETRRLYDSVTGRDHAA